MSEFLPEPATHAEALELLLTRRSHPARLLSGPAPTRATLDRLLTAALRVPDHGKLEPWRLVVITGNARARLVALLQARGKAEGRDPDKIDKDAAAWSSPVVVAVITTPRPTDRIPEREQLLSAGAVCLSLVNAALAQGLGACWLTGFAAYDGAFGREGLGLASGETVAGLIHIGRSAGAPPDRPRPDPEQAIRWIDE
jgi:nitroreductase